MPVRCPECRYDNRDNYRFCGMCGASLRPAPAPQRKAGTREQGAVVTEPPPPVRQPTPPREAESAPVSGPSFLGLADAPSGSDVRYLLEDEESHSGGKRMLAAFLLLVVAGGLVYWRWSRDGFPWSGSGSSHQAQAPVLSGASTAPAPAEPLPPPSNDAARSSTPPVVPSSDEAHMTKSDDSASGSAESTSRQKPDADKTDQELLAASPDASKPSGAANNNPEPSASPDESPSQTPPAPKPTVPAKPTRSAAATKPAPTQAPVSGDDQLVTDGEKYLYGNGVPANCDRAQKSLRAAAGHGNAKALSMIGTMYATGHCVDRDLPNAYRNFAKALHLDPSNSRIQSDLEILWRQMSSEERQAATHNAQ